MSNSSVAHKSAFLGGTRFLFRKRESILSLVGNAVLSHVVQQGQYNNDGAIIASQEKTRSFANFRFERRQQHCFQRRSVGSNGAG
jgi:hypothetical protein